MQNLKDLYQKYGAYHCLYQKLNPPSPSVDFAWKKTKDLIFAEAIKNIHKLSKYKKYLKICDIGCGNGGLLLRLAREINDPNVSFYGYDISVPFIKFANQAAKFKKLQQIEFRQLDVEKQNLPHNFDLVISSELLEHLVAPENFIKKIHTALTDQGYLLLTTPNRNNWIKYPFWFLRSPTHNRQQAAFAKNLTADEQVLLVAEHEQHLYVYTHKELVELLQKSGFSVYKVKRSSLLFGGSFLDRHPMLLALVLVADSLLDLLPFPQFGWDIICFSQKTEIIPA